MPLTNIAIKSAKLKDKQYKLSDKNGLYLLVHPNVGKEKTCSLGVYDEVSLIEASPVGKVVLNGRGAGAGPTASAVAADIIDICNNRITHTFNIPANKLENIAASLISEITSEYYLRLQVNDEAGVLEAITHELREQKISVHKFLQEDVINGTAQVIIITHAVKEAVLNEAAKKLAKLSSVKEAPQIIRILG